MLEGLRHKVARWIAPVKVNRQQKFLANMARIYHSAEGGRLTGGWKSSNNSSDTELRSSLQKLRARSRALVRDVGYAKRAKVIVVNNVIGAGMGMQAQVSNMRDRLLEDVNNNIEEAWREWSYCNSCHTGGVLEFADIERLAMGQIFEAGEIFIRKHYSRFGESKIPLALEVIEAERIAEEFLAPVTTPNELRMGVEVNNFNRPIAYWVKDRHPGDLRTSSFAIDRLQRIPADQMIHLYICDRWPQTRGEPWMHAVARRLNDMDGYSEAEIIAARGGANYMAFLHTPDADDIPADAREGNQKITELAPGIVEQLPPGWEMEFNNPNRPNPNLDPFMRYMLREVAAGTGPSYESLSRDYSQSNYSSSRLALLDDRDLWRVFQQWWIRKFRFPLHREFVQLGVLSRVISSIDLAEFVTNTRKFESVAFKPRGWTWVDPQKEVDALAKAVRSGFTTLTDVISLTGNGDDIEDMLKKRLRELELAKEKDLVFDTDPGVDASGKPPAPEPAAPAPQPEDNANPDGETAAPGRVVSMRVSK